MKGKVISVLVFLVLIQTKSSEATSCQDRCGEEYNSTSECQCTDNCLAFQNCCEDFITLCTKEDSCSNRCSEPHNSSFSCHCDRGCAAFGNCCDDIATTCVVSCSGRCGENFDSSNYCQCNDECRIYGNCCEDYFDVQCASKESCNNRCGESYDQSVACQCTKECRDYGNCCEDFSTLCLGSTCEGRCGEINAPSGASCHCDANCTANNNCCEDFSEFCEEKYFCKGECGKQLERCSCKPECVQNKNCCADFQELCLGESPWAEEDCASSDQMGCPADFDVPPVILFSLDGFKSEYIYRNLTPNVWKLASCGAHAPYMRAVYPTKTFPNHYTLATGLYPESHGIVDNRMYDHDLQEEFRLGSEESFHPYWWGGEPIWVTTSNQGKLSACYFWPGSDVNITRYPDYYYKFDDSIAYEERMYEALDWLDLSKEKRPSFITLYMELVDSAGHAGGPDSPEVNSALAEADKYISILMNGLKLRNLENCVNIIMLADHGMAPISCDRKTSLEEYGVDLSVVDATTGSFGRVGKSINPDLWGQFNAEDVHNKLRCTHNESHWLSYLKYRYLPKRYHYAYNERIEPVHVVMDDGWLIEKGTNSNNNCNGGNHGYDNEFTSMHSLFTAHGPGFKRQFNTSEPFEAIEVYNLMTDLLKINPAPNNGTAGSLYHMMTEPPALREYVINPAAECPVEEPPQANHSCSVCTGATDDDIKARLQLSESEVSGFRLMGHCSMVVGPCNGFQWVTELVSMSLEKNLPFGPSTVGVNVCRLTQHDYINMFNKDKRTSEYVSFTLEKADFQLLAPLDCLRPDPRLPSHTATCQEYNSSTNIHPVPLYPPELSNGDAIYDAAILSNQVPMYNATQKIWNYTARSMAEWTVSYGSIHVIAGPIYDYNLDGKVDSDKILKEQGKYLTNDDGAIPIPTQYFLIAIRCKEIGTPLVLCKDSPDKMDVLSFIIPNYEVEPCGMENQADSDWIPNTLFEHVSRIRDIELLTGLLFFPNFHKPDSNSAIRFKLRLPQFTSSWLLDFVNVVPPTSSTTGNNAVIASLSGQVQVILAILWLLVYSNFSS